MTSFNKLEMVPAANALTGRKEKIVVPSSHFVNCHSLEPPFPENSEVVYLGMGCFWGAERLFWQLEGVWTTAVGYAGGYTENPSYEEVCSGGTGHAEVVMVVYQPDQITFQLVLKHFWESHDPTQGMQQGNDKGTQYRSVIYTTTETQLKQAHSSYEAYNRVLEREGHGAITTEMMEVPPFYYAEAYHQQYLAKNPGGYCGIGGTGACLP